MDFGIFSTPYSVGYLNGTRTARDVIAWDLQLTRWADELGLAEAFFAEHFTIGYEPSPSPDMMIAAASQVTERIKLGAAAHLLPYHHPVNLAHRLMYLDHMTGGRYIAGFAPGAFPTDAQLFATNGHNQEMMVEAIEIVKAIWTRPGPYRIEGKYWTVDMPEYSEQWGGPHLKMLQSPGPEVVMTGTQPQSPTFAEAAKHGFSPMSQQVNPETLRAQWEFYESNALEHGHRPDRASWRLVRDTFVADTDDEARQLVLEGAFGSTWESHILPAFKMLRPGGDGKAPMALGHLMIEPGMELDDLTVEWLVDNFFLVGSPETVADKVVALNDAVGGFGEVVTITFDYSDQPEVYRRSLELLATEVAPRLTDVGARSAARA
jgi:alkanesulfonate monooxygenase SsuD/methylene tetrahydromethanopterin reductase-like flavin-dependent oxidoreductase (luciferase family)